MQKWLPKLPKFFSLFFLFHLDFVIYSFFFYDDLIFFPRTGRINFIDPLLKFSIMIPNVMNGVLVCLNRKKNTSTVNECHFLNQCT